MTVNLGERNKYYWTKEDIKNDKNILIKPEVKDRMDEPSGKNGEWYSIKGVDLLNKLNGTGSKVSTSYKYDEAGNQIGGGTESTTGKNYKYL